MSDNQYFHDFSDEDLPETAKKAQIDTRSLRQVRSVVLEGRTGIVSVSYHRVLFMTILPRRAMTKRNRNFPKSVFMPIPSLFSKPLFSMNWPLPILTSPLTNSGGKGIEAHRGDLFPRISYPMRLFNVLRFESNVGLRETFYGDYHDPTGQHHRWKSRETFEAGAEVSTEFYRVMMGRSFPRFPIFLGGEMDAHH